MGNVRTSSPTPTSPDVSARMARHPRRDTLPELAVRRLLHRRGLRYRVDIRPDPAIPRRGDVVFSRARVVVFIDGCYWHGCPDHCRVSGLNAAWWRQKIATTSQRDAHTDLLLQEKGWKVLRFWEHQEPATCADAIAKAVLSRVTPATGTIGRVRHTPPEQEVPANPRLALPLEQAAADCSGTELPVGSTSAISPPSRRLRSGW